MCIHTEATLLGETDRDNQSVKIALHAMPPRPDQVCLTVITKCATILWYIPVELLLRRCAEVESTADGAISLWVEDDFAILSLAVLDPQEKNVGSLEIVISDNALIEIIQALRAILN
jgi:hypothetical protein